MKPFKIYGFCVFSMCVYGLFAVCYTFEWPLQGPEHSVAWEFEHFCEKFPFFGCMDLGLTGAELKGAEWFVSLKKLDNFWPGTSCLFLSPLPTF